MRSHAGRGTRRVLRSPKWTSNKHAETSRVANLTEHNWQGSLAGLTLAHFFGSWFARKRAPALGVKGVTMGIDLAANRRGTGVQKVTEL